MPTLSPRSLSLSPRSRSPRGLRPRRTTRQITGLMLVTAIGLAASLLGAATPASAATPGQTPITVAVKAVRVLEETDEVGSDEPYVVVWAADLSKKVAGIVVPSGKTTVYGTWGGADTTDLLTTTPWACTAGAPPAILFLARACAWGINGKPAAIATPNNVVILAAVMESDDGSSSNVRSIVNSSMTAAIVSVVNSGMSRSDMIASLRSSMNDALSLGAMGFPNSDDRVGGSQELKLTNADIAAAAGGSTVKNLTFTGDGGQYRVGFELRKW